MAQRLAMVSISVPREQAVQVKAFYGETLGFPLMTDPEDPQAGPQIENGDGPRILIYPVPSEDLKGSRETGLVFQVKDIDHTVQEWKAKGVRFTKVPWSKEESGIGPCPFGRFIYFHDPFGNQFELLQPVARP